jgi:hypothetical protein
MATLTLEYNSRNKTAHQIMEGLLLSGVFVVKNADAHTHRRTKNGQQTAREKHIAEFKEAIQQTEAMAHDIRQNETKGYKTLDELLAED